jgi:hypothetical protein
VKIKRLSNGQPFLYAIPTKGRGAFLFFNRAQIRPRPNNVIDLTYWRHLLPMPETAGRLFRELPFNPTFRNSRSVYLITVSERVNLVAVIPGIKPFGFTKKSAL